MYPQIITTRRPRPSLDLRRAVPRNVRRSWSAVAAPHAGPPTAVSEALVAECRCPTDCIRDHENE